MDTKLAAGNLSDATSNDDVRRLFAQTGAVDLVSVIKDHATGVPTGPALITLVTQADTQQAINMFNAYRLGEQSMAVSLASPRLLRADSRSRLVRTSRRPHRFQSRPGR